MKLKDGVTLAGLHPVMRPVLREAEAIWKAHGRSEGVTVTEARGGEHSAVSWHYYGFALDLRTRYFDFDEAVQVYETLKGALSGYDVVHHTYQNDDDEWASSHIHVEIGNGIAADLKVLY
jgi:hypothetical protein